MTASGANSEQIKLDLNYPAFQKELFNLDANEIKKLIKTFTKLSKMSWDQLFTDHGLNWEEIKSQSGTYTVRVSLQYRAVVVRDVGFMRFQTLVTDHDRA
jgi:hypothetical protein